MRLRLVLGGLLAALSLAPAAASASTSQKPLSDAVPIASGQFFGKPGGILVYESTFGLCVRESAVVERSTTISCGKGSPLPVDGKAIEIDGYGGTTVSGHSVSGHSYTDLSGKLRPDVASVQIFFHRSGQRRSITPISGLLSTAGAATVQAPQFGRFLTVVGGCIPEREFKVVAFAADGTILGSQRGLRTFGFCHPFVPSTTPPPAPRAFEALPRGLAAQ